ncbi:MAG: primosomal protein N' [Legionellaceae bacterium]|nr:primosomal protein N' [Legionellaceae bacterium]
MQVYKVAVLNTIHDSFDYRVENLSPVIGARVWVMFRNTKRLGVVVGIGEPERLDIEFKPIISVIDEQQLIPDEILSLSRWVSTYYQAALPAVLSLVLPKKYRLGGEALLPTTEYYSLALSAEKSLESISKKAKKQLEIIDYLLKKSNPVSKQELMQESFTSAQLQALLDKKILKKQISTAKPVINFDKTSYPLPLNNEQKNACDIISRSLSSYHCFLLKGVTGSGKTEVYLQVIAKVLEKKQQVLILVPEIGLTPQLLERFSSRFKEHMLVIHSNLNDTERQQAWQLAHANEVQLIIGTRSAIFTPMPNLGLIVIDEEHDLSLKQMDGVRYFARDTALMRAFSANIPVILGSATPSLESIYNCRLKKYTLLELNEKAIDSPPLHYQILDIRNQKLQNGLAKDTIELISEHLSQDNQVLVFINRRGFSPVLFCHDCGFVADCPYCDTHLTFHRKINKLMCHHCGLVKPKTNRCGGCHGHNLVPIGVGTQRVYEYLSEIFPTTRVLRIDRDETSRKNAINEYLESIRSGDAQLIIGTQMLAKGHHFPNLNLVVILDADSGFYNQDFRALERLGQLLVQVSGRSGRAETPGQVLIQTALPKDPLLNILIQEGYESFADLLLDGRKQAMLPPYTNLAMFRAQCSSQQELLEFMHMVKKQLLIHDITVLGPALAPLAKKSGQYRMQLMLKSPSRKKLSQSLSVMRDELSTKKISSRLRWNIDVDPMDLA